LKARRLDTAAQVDNFHPALVQHVDIFWKWALGGWASNVIDAMRGAINNVHGA